MTDTFFKELTEELQRGISKKDHPFRYCTLGTVGADATARLRTVVLRRVSASLQLIFYTDRRSRKIDHIRENNTVCLLLYHPKKLLQLKITGRANIVSDPEQLKECWSSVQPASKKDYTTTSVPGSSISNPDAIEYLKDKNHFAIVEIEPIKIEYLKLKRPNHLRIRFSKKDGEWDGEFLVP